MKIHTQEHITERLDTIQGILEAEYAGDEGHIVNERLQQIATYMAESGKLKADADFHFQAKLNSEIMAAIKGLLPDYSSASLQNQFVKSLAKDEQHLATYADRVNRSCTHQIEVMRTQISYLKALRF
ncbi:MAG: hypothetical protein ABI851_16025 [Saprospiraceae bacterium]